MSPQINVRSLEQRLEALDRANAVRTGRAALKRDLKAGEVSVDGLLSDPPPLIDGMKVYELLLAAPGLGRVKVDKMLKQCRISPTRSVSGITSRQREELVATCRRSERTRLLLR